MADCAYQEYLMKCSLLMKVSRTWSTFAHKPSQYFSYWRRGGISLITAVLHLSSNPTNGFKIAFTSFGLGLLFAFRLIFLMPTGK